MDRAGDGVDESMFKDAVAGMRESWESEKNAEAKEAGPEQGSN